MIRGKLSNFIISKSQEEIKCSHLILKHGETYSTKFDKFRDVIDTIFNFNTLFDQYDYILL